MTMAVWNVERWAAAVAAGQKRLLLWSIHWDINFYPQVEGRPQWLGTFRTTMSIDAEVEALDGQQLLKERPGGSTFNKRSLLKRFVRGFVRNARARE